MAAHRTPRRSRRTGTRTGRRRRSQRSLGIPFYPVSITGTFDEAFEDGQILNLFIEVEDRVPTYTIDDSRQPSPTSASSRDETPTLRLVLRLDEENQWRVEQIAVDS